MKEEIYKYKAPTTTAPLPPPQIDMTIREAFKHLTSQYRWWKGTDVKPLSAGSYKREFRKGTLTEATMRGILQQAGYVERPAKWSKG